MLQKGVIDLKLDSDEFSKLYESRDVSIVLKDGQKLSGYVEVVFPPDEDDKNKASFYLSTNPGHADIYIDDIDSIK